MKFYIIRHGETDWNREGRLQGKTDIELNKKGIEQAKKTKAILQKYHIDMIVSSTLKRARKTAQIINEEKKLPIIFTKALEERGFGELEGKIRKEIQDEILDSQMLANYELNKKYKGIEPIQDLCDRVWGLLEDLKNEYSDKDILIVTHGGVIRTINGYFNGTNEKGIFEDLYLNNCEIKVYEINKK